MATLKATAGAGRPRLYSDQTEQQMLVDAAVKVLAVADRGAISLCAILAEVRRRA